MSRKPKTNKASTTFKKPSFWLQYKTCLYKHSIILLKAPESFIVTLFIPALVIALLVLLQTLIFRASPYMTIATEDQNTPYLIPKNYEGDFPRCDTIPEHDFLSLPCLDFAVIYDSDLTAKQLQKATLQINWIIDTYGLNATYFTDYIEFRNQLYSSQRSHDVLTAIQVKKSSLGYEFVIHGTESRYSTSIKDSMIIQSWPGQTMFWKPILKALYETWYGAEKAGKWVATKLAEPELMAWPSKSYLGDSPLAFFVGTIVILSAASMLALLTTFLLEDLSHPQSALMTFLGISVPARCLSWLTLSLPLVIIQPLIIYALGVAADISLFTAKKWYVAIAPVFFFTLTLIPCSFLIAMCVTPNIAKPALSGRNPALVATYAIGVVVIVTSIILAPIGSLVMVIGTIKGAQKSAIIVAYCFRMLNFAIGTSLCALGIGQEGSIGIGLTWNEVGWLAFDSVWMTIVALIVAIFKCKSVNWHTKSLADDTVSRVDRETVDSLIQSGETEGTLIVQNLWKVFGKLHALSGIYLHVNKGEIVMLQGINGSGKTTTLHSIVGLEPITHGNITYDGTIGYVSQYNTLWNQLTALQHIKIVMMVRGANKQALKEAYKYLEAVNLLAAAKRKVGTFSYGMKRRTCLAMSLASEPSLLVLDEVTAGVDPVSAEHIWDAIKKKKDEGTSVIISSNGVKECEVLADRVYVLAAGEVATVGTIRDLKNNHGLGYSMMVFCEDKEYVMHQANNLIPEIQSMVVNSDHLFTAILNELPMDQVERIYKILSSIDGVIQITLKSSSLEQIFNSYAGSIERDELGFAKSILAFK